MQVKRVLTSGAVPADSDLVLGVTCRKTLAHKRMRSSIVQPRIMPAASQLSSFDSLLDQEQRYLAAAVDKIVSFHPDVLLVERSVGR